MPLIDMRDMLNHAYHNGYAVGGFDLVGLDFLEAVLAAAEHCRAPVILSLAEAHFEPLGLDLMIAAAEKAARSAAVPVAIHFDRGASPESAVHAINLGCNGVRVNGRQASFPANVAQTRGVVEMAHACGVTVEGELGGAADVAGDEAGTHPGERACTSVEEAKAFVARTGVDCLAVSIGTTQGRSRGRPKLDFERLKRINEAVKIPLAIHGDAGVSDEQFRKLIANGTAKINYHTSLADAAGDHIRANAHTDACGGYAGLMCGVRGAIRAHAERCMHLWGSAGRAAEVLIQCRAWQSVEHVITYNVEGATDRQVEEMMARGREVLGHIPGVRRVVTGWAVTEKPKYRFCWIVSFANEKVIASYRDHPDHVAFANQLFRPIASDRLSIDFAQVSNPPLSKAYQKSYSVAG